MSTEEIKQTPKPEENIPPSTNEEEESSEDGAKVEIGVDSLQQLTNAVKESTSALQQSTETIKKLQEQNTKGLKELGKAYEEQIKELRNNLPFRTFGHATVEGYYDFNKAENKFYLDQTNKDKIKGMTDLKNIITHF